ncbi:hypothetical protein OAD97_00045 [bacterium]|nr:hypothetical protein [bacterium]
MKVKESKQHTKMKEQKLSLFDYLGKAAGMELGEKVFKASVSMNIKPESRDVDTKTYCGKVMLYPKDFLEVYFKYNK